MVSDDAYLRACRALNWRTAQLRAHGIEPLRLSPESPHEPPIGFDFGVPSVEDLDWLLYQFKANLDFCEQNYGPIGSLEYQKDRERAERVVAEWKKGRI